MSYYLSNHSWGELVGLYPDLGFMVTESIKITPVDFIAFDGVRTIEEQRKLVEAGASQTMNSYHLYGLAVDLVPWINGKPRWEHEPLDRIREAVKQVIATHGLDIDNGYDLWGWDKPHWQLTGYMAKYDIRKVLNND